MKTFIILCAISFFTHMAYAQNSRTFTEASELTVTGKLIKTANPYHRVDTSEFKGFSKTENGYSQVQVSARNRMMENQ